MKKKEIELIIKNTAHWNGGAGLVIPTRVAKLLREMGIKKGYTESKNVNDQNKQ